MIRAISAFLNRDEKEGFRSSGSDFAGRRWYRGRLTRRTMEAIAKQFFSVQSIHPPLRSALAAAKGTRKASASATSIASAIPVPVSSLPCVAVVDTGVPAEHIELAPYRRGTVQGETGSVGYQGDHGSFVASRVVFGDLDFSAGILPRPPGTCSFFDVLVAEEPGHIEDRTVLSAINTVVATAPDVRVFNLSIGAYPSLDAYPLVEKRERLLIAQDLDNFVFANDILVILAAGNSPPGLLPSDPYPDHYDDPRWALGHWASRIQYPQVRFNCRSPCT